MSRPLKQGLDYFSIDVTFDDNLDYIISEYGAEGLGIVIGLFQKIYREGYYIEWDEKALSLFSRRINAEKSTIEKVLDSCFKEGIFDQIMYKKYNILTSKGIQNRYLKICKDCRRKIVIFNKNYLLGVNADLIKVISEFIPSDVGVNTEFIPSDVGVNAEEVTVNVKETSINAEEIHERERERERERESIENSQAEVFHDVLKNIKNYQLDLEQDKKLFNDLSERFPQLDILQAIKKFAVYKKDKPLKLNSNVISQINASFEKYVEWGECLKTPNPPAKKREVWV